MGPDGTESGPNVPDWYLTYEGPAPIVEESMRKLRCGQGSGVIPVDFYIDKWGLPRIQLN